MIRIAFLQGGFNIRHGKRKVGVFLCFIDNPFPVIHLYDAKFDDLMEIIVEGALDKYDLRPQHVVSNDLVLGGNAANMA